MIGIAHAYGEEFGYKDYLLKGFCYTVSSNSDVRIIHDPWILDVKNFKPSPHLDLPQMSQESNISLIKI